MGQTGRHNQASQQVLAYLHEHANIAIPHEEIQKAIGATHKFTVANAITQLTGKGINLERPMRGMVIYRTAPKLPEPMPEPEMPTQKLYEFVGNSGGVTILRGEDDELYVVTPLAEFITRQP